jgi:hypothetical protein
MEHINESIEIEASPDLVWQVLVDFERYSEWNPQIVRLIGSPVVGATLDEWVTVSDEKQVRFKTVILELLPAGKLVWRGVYGSRWLFCGLHQFILEPLEDGSRTRLIQQETFSGILLPLMNIKESAVGYRRMNEALKRRAENAPASTPA